MSFTGLRLLFVTCSPVVFASIFLLLIFSGISFSRFLLVNLYFSRTFMFVRRISFRLWLLFYRIVVSLWWEYGSYLIFQTLVFNNVNRWKKKWKHIIKIRWHRFSSQSKRSCWIFDLEDKWWAHFLHCIGPQSRNFLLEAQEFVCTYAWT